MGVKFSSFKTDKAKVNNGTRIELPGGLVLIIARFGNTRFANYITKHGSKFSKVPYAIDDDDDDGDPIVREAIARYILLGWENLEDDDGNNIEYSVETAIELLKEEEFRKVVIAESQDIDNFRLTETKETAKN